MRPILLVGLVLALATPTRADNLKVKYTTAANGGPYAPRYVSATWIEDSAGNFVRTIDRRAGVRASNLLAWVAKSGLDTDAITGATQLTHTAPLAIHWDMTNKQGIVVPDGTYTIRMEVSDSDPSSASQNLQGSFTFVKGPIGSTQINLANGSFTMGTIIFALGNCANDVVDPGETCDGNCPTSCSATGNACAISSLVGDASTCSSSCAVDYITACIDNDGCCAKGCDETTDSDCKPGAGGGGGENDPNTIYGGCETGPGGSLWMGLAIAAALTLHRKRRVCFGA